MSKEHWQKIFTTKLDDQVSWTQKHPTTVIDYMTEISLTNEAKIIEVGGGASKFSSALLALGYSDITVLDISEAALHRSQKRLDEKASRVKWLVSNILDFEPKEKYDFWYDRAVFHFLTDEEDINLYIDIVTKSVKSGGHFLLGTFSDQGPLKCSGLEVSRYSARSMKETFQPSFHALRCFTEEHKTPFETTQEFQFCGFQRAE